MRVLHVQKSTGIGGSERHLISLLPGLAAVGVEVRMVVMLAGDGERFIRALRSNGVDTTHIEAGRDLSPSAFRGLRRQIRDFDPDLVHTHLIHADLHAQTAARSVGVPGVSTIHSAHSFYRRQPYRSAARVAGRLARRTIAISDHVRRMIAEARLARSNHIRVVHYGVDGAGWEGDAPSRASARAAFGVDDDIVGVGIASRLIPLKGHDVLIQAFADAHRQNPRLRLLIAGSGPLEDDLKRLAAASVAPESIRFPGFVEDVPRFMLACDVLVFPTLPALSEGFGLAALEAMAAGRPVIASDVGPLPEVVLNGVTGLVVPASNVKALADAIVELAGSPALRERLGVAGQSRARQEFSLDHMVAGTLAVYEDVVGELRHEAPASNSPGRGS